MRYKASAKQLLGAILCNDLEHRDTPVLFVYHTTSKKPPPLSAKEQGGDKAGDPIPGRRKTGSDGDGHSNDHQSGEDSEQQDKQSSI